MSRPALALRRGARLLAVAAALVIGATSKLHGQTSTARITGLVTDSAGAPLSDVTVTARSTATNLTRNARTSERGFYALPGLPPDEYEITVQRIGLQPQSRTVRPLIGQSIEVNFRLIPATVTLAGIQVVAEPADVAERRSPEVSTNISEEQIENLPANDRNFLGLATLAPGVRQEGGSITSGGQSANNINVFIDGVSFKSDILQGGLAGQDASKGNPFPQNAVQEFRVITQQYKAEYQRATSAVINAKTKSGTNTVTGDLFVFNQTQGLIGLDFFAERACNEQKALDPPEPCDPKPKLDKWQLGGSIGGPIVRDKLFYFASYEGNLQTRAGTVTMGAVPADMPAALATQLEEHEGTFESPFRSHLFFGKLSYQAGERHLLEGSVNIRDEYDIRNFSGRNSYENAEHFFNDVDTYQLRHQYVRSNWLNEASASFQTYRWNPIPLFMDQVGVNYQDVLKIGGRSTLQDFDQRRLAFRDDISYTKFGWFGDHVFKAGANLDFLDYRINRPLNGVPQYTFNGTNDWAFPVTATAGFGNPDLSTTNTQLGLYLQDDWSVSSRLTLNLGVRWDYETNMLNNEYVTPDSIRQTVADFVETLPCDGSDPKREQLCDPEPYMTDGDDRPPFLGAIQPRIGFSYDALGTGNTIVFGGWGLYYDRNRYGNVLSEQGNLQWSTYTFRFSSDGAPVNGNETIVWDDAYFTREGLASILETGSAPEPELFLTKNETKPPMAHQFSLGVRQALGDYAVSASYTGVRGYNIFTWIRANRRADGGCCTPEPPGYSNLFVSSDDARTWYDAMFLKVEKRYTAESRWGMQIAYTLAKEEEEADPSGVFSALNTFTVNDFARYPTPNDERHRLTANWVVGLPYDVIFSGILDLGSGNAYNATIGFGAGANNCVQGNADCQGGDLPPGENRNSFRPPRHSFLLPDFWAFRNIDVRLEKEFATVRGQSVAVIAEVFNVFDFVNYNGFDTRWASYERADRDAAGTPVILKLNPAFGTPTSAVTSGFRGAPRRFQIGMKYGF